MITYKEDILATDDEVIIPFGESIDFNVLTNDIVSEEVEVTFINGPNFGSLVPLGKGQFTYTPPFNFVGTDVANYLLSSKGCDQVIGTVTFRVGENAACEAPSIITPNGDGINDVFVVPCLLDNTNFPANRVLIFNQWGDEVYRSSTPYTNDWNGTFDGEDLPAGTYFYIIDFGDGITPLNGFLVIHR